mmetsp:Transcript_31727/g.101096  ORF Transcript_31727/g.101096 Transcript_31727/m.101096 type:complete len:227 (-) Transcript_31727:25-705(-)
MAHDLVHLLRRAAKVVQRTTAPVLIRFRVHLEDEVVVAVHVPLLGQSRRGLQLLQELAQVGAQVPHALEEDLAEERRLLHARLERRQGLEGADVQVHVLQRPRARDGPRAGRHVAPELTVAHLQVDGCRPVAFRTSGQSQLPLLRQWNIVDHGQEARLQRQLRRRHGLRGMAEDRNGLRRGALLPKAEQPQEVCHTAACAWRVHGSRPAAVQAPQLPRGVTLSADS